MTMKRLCPAGGRSRRVTASARFGLGKAVARAGLAFALVYAGGPAGASPRQALALTVSGCVAAFEVLQIPFPCLFVEKGGAADDGFAVLRPPSMRTEVLVTPTAPIKGIESPALLHPGTPNYFVDAWAARRFVVERLGRDPGWNAIGMAVNSPRTRSQDRLHIHVDCLQPSVIRKLRHLPPLKHDGWTRLPITLMGRNYWGRAAREAEFAAMNPFRSLAEGPPRTKHGLGLATLVVAGAILPDGAKGFYLLAANGFLPTGPAVGENLLDHGCALSR